MHGIPVRTLIQQEYSDLDDETKQKFSPQFKQIILNSKTVNTPKKKSKNKSEKAKNKSVQKGNKKSKRSTKK